LCGGTLLLNMDHSPGTIGLSITTAVRLLAEVVPSGGLGAHEPY